MPTTRTPKTFSLAGLDHALLEADHLALPILPNAEADDLIAQAIHTAMTQGRIVAVTGAKGSGKSIAVQGTIARFDAGESAREELSAEYIPRMVVRVGTIRTDDPRTVLSLIYRATVGQDLMLTGAKGLRRPPEFLMRVVVDTLRSCNVAALVIDEAELLSSTALAVLRDVLTIAESSPEGRIEMRGDAGVYRPSPFGVVLVGTEVLQHRLLATEEWGQRILTCMEIPPLEWAGVAAAYEGSLPAIAKHATESTEAWHQLLGECWATPPSWREIENHVRTYLRLVSYHHTGTPATSVAFSPEIFGLAVRQVARVA
jgi:type II secretory pathway predicted ATPase ExeA